MVNESANSSESFAALLKLLHEARVPNRHDSDGAEDLLDHQAITHACFGAYAPQLRISGGTIGYTFHEWS
jgi:hypothetical protein